MTALQQLATHLVLAIDDHSHLVTSECRRNVKGVSASKWLDEVRDKHNHHTGMHLLLHFILNIGGSSHYCGMLELL